VLIDLFSPLCEKLVPLFQKKPLLYPFFLPLPDRKCPADFDFWGSTISFSAAESIF
jgi:hypothetical protein